MTIAQLILAVRRQLIPRELASSGFHELASQEITSVLSNAGLWLGPRAELENDEAFRQLIPYIVLVRQSHVLCYRRSTSGAERRLHGRLSIGLGGHVDLGDVVLDDQEIDLGKTLLTAAQREVMEEVGAVNVIDRQWVGVLVDDDTPVGRVHLGVVGVWVVADGVIEAAEDALRQVQQLPIGNVQCAAAELETWSAMLAPRLGMFVRPQS